MDLAEIVRVMRRRWYVLVPGVLLTVALTVGAYLKVPVTYTSQSTVVLLNSKKATVAFDGNPYLSTQIALNGMADSLARNLNSDGAVAHLKSQGATCATAAKLADNAMGPLLWLTATGTDKAAVLATDKLLTTYAAERLDQFQTEQSVTQAAMIRMATIVPPQNPVAQTKTRYEYLALAAVLGLVMSLVATFYVEARFRRPGPRQAGAAAGLGADRTPAGEPDVPRDRAEQPPAAQPGPARQAAVEPPSERSGRSSAVPAARKAPSWSVPSGGLDRDALEVGALEPDPTAPPSVSGSPGAPQAAPETSGPADAAGYDGMSGGDAAGTDAHRFV
ncbi:chain length determinant protein [Actinacidiphila acidipaludis]|uniref:Chain length determinant protein n=1 Tax=Actinacidiphila acidipaludis TaxID=2873382 RepID=A0ABS7QBH9_9ACTN|nr:chain length determinant protein [Streptomyces acidipaludis]MBY8880054.1 chain length determinant protein [Streptomyces acidipaludis]